MELHRRLLDPHQQQLQSLFKFTQANYFSPDTIVALATAVTGPVIILRVSGTESKKVYEALTQKKVDTPRKLISTAFYDGDKKIDLGLAVFFEGPASFTGEDVVEFHLHGGVQGAEQALRAVLGLAQKRGLLIRQALPGEFSFRAVKNGKQTLSQARAVSELISASSEAGHGLALEKMQGLQSRVVGGIAQEIREMVARCEAGLDFSDQDLEEETSLELRALKQDARLVIQRLKNLESSFDRGVRLKDGIPIVFLGEPNAGKSSLFNALLGEERAIVSSIPGTTRDVLKERVILRGEFGPISVRVFDTAGIRPETQDPIEKIGIHKTVKTVKEAALVLLLVEAEQLETKEGFLRVIQRLLEKIGSKENTVQQKILVITKQDLVLIKKEINSEQLKECGLLSGETPVFYTSAKTGEGISELFLALGRQAEKMTQREEGELVLTQQEDVLSVQQTIRFLEQATANDIKSADLFAADLRQALHALSPVIGETPTEEILGKIFSSFCIGK